jgi:2-polyprenyl-3-methyl-5-hydroxy-6-metoxy-1,4-benzoquinol methylase
MNRIEKNSCPSCLCQGFLEHFYRIKNTPVHQNGIYNTLDRAINCKKGEISLTFCHNCGMIFNSKFESKLLEYGELYNNKQSASEYFRTYLNDTVNLLVQKYAIKNKRILDVGCGNGEFLELLSMTSHSKGIGFDPSYIGPNQTPNAQFVSDYLTEKYSPIKTDVLIFRHVLEHIDEPNHFLSNILQYLKVDIECKIIIEVPDFDWITDHGAYWDIFYEHVNYFSKQSLRNLLESIGLEVIDIINQFEGQYMIVIASYRPDSINQNETKNAYTVSKTRIDYFKTNIELKNKEVEQIINQIGDKSDFTIWGAGAKGVTFLNYLKNDIQQRIPFVIDMNEVKQGKYCPGTGHKIMSPTILKSRKDIKDIIVMNPNYFHEISIYLSENRKFNLFSI